MVAFSFLPGKMSNKVFDGKIWSKRGGLKIDSTLKRGLYKKRLAPVALRSMNRHNQAPAMMSTKRIVRENRICKISNI